MNIDSKHKDLIHSSLFAALTIALGFISVPVPISPVPISGISLGVMLAGSILSPRQAAYSVLVIILLAAAGLPVLSGFTGGLGVLLGPRGGYYVGFMVGAAVIAFLRGNNGSMLRLFLANITGGIIIAYLFAVPWLSLVTGMPLLPSIMAGAAPFIIGDLLKAAIATVFGAALRKRLGAL